MPAWLTPPRRRGAEILDDAATPAAVRDAAMADVERSNRLFGGLRAVQRALAPLIGQRRAMLVLDVGTGRGDIPARVLADAGRRGIPLTCVGMDVSESLARGARDRIGAAAVGSATRLPFRDGSADVVVASQLVHHFFDAELRALIAELDRVARGWVVIADLERSVLGAAAFWLASLVLRFHRVTRVDGVTSVLRGFTPDELETLVRDVTGRRAVVRRGLFCRITATWRTG